MKSRGEHIRIPYERHMTYLERVSELEGRINRGIIYDVTFRLPGHPGHPDHPDHLSHPGHDWFHGYYHSDIEMVLLDDLSLDNMHEI